MSTIYSPPELRVEETTVYSFADQVIPIIYDASLYGNLSSPLLDLTTLIKSKLPYITDKYGFHIEMVSSGITSIEVDTSIKVYTIMQGNVTILMIYSNVLLNVHCLCLLQHWLRPKKLWRHTDILQTSQIFSKALSA